MITHNKINNNPLPPPPPPPPKHTHTIHQNIARCAVSKENNTRCNTVCTCMAGYCSHISRVQRTGSFTIFMQRAKMNMPPTRMFAFYWIQIQSDGSKKQTDNTLLDSDQSSRVPLNGEQTNSMLMTKIITTSAKPVIVRLEIRLIRKSIRDRQKKNQFFTRLFGKRQKKSFFS